MAKPLFGLWSSSSAIVAKSTPFYLRRDANGCRQSSQRNGAIPRSAHGIREPMAIYEATSRRQRSSPPAHFHFICPPSRFCRILHRKGLSLLFDFVFGLESGVPWCCVLEYCRRTHLLRQHDLSARLTGIGVFEMCSWLNSVSVGDIADSLWTTSFIPWVFCQRRSREVICGGCRLGRGCDRAGRPGFAT
jgi:hypothetical protein